MKRASAFAPATVANVACGFDILGFALDEPGDEVQAELTENEGVKITAITGDEGRLPLDADKNTASVAVQQLLHATGIKQGVSLELHKKLPLGSGLGSSAASAVAAVVAVNALLETPLSREDLLPFTMEAERIACGAGHADNVGPALLGGFVLIRSYDPLDIIKIPAPEKLCCAVVNPQIEVRTEDARKILRRQVLLKDAVVQWGNIAGLIAGLMKADYALIGRSMKDVIIEPVRSLLIPGYDLVKQAAMEHGALGCSISGSGPSVFALSDDPAKAALTGEHMQQVFVEMGIESTLYVSRVNNLGAKVGSNSKF